VRLPFYLTASSDVTQNIFFVANGNCFVRHRKNSLPVSIVFSFCLAFMHGFPSRTPFKHFHAFIVKLQNCSLFYAYFALQAPALCSAFPKPILETHTRDGSLSVSNPTRAFDTLLG